MMNPFRALARNEKHPAFSKELGKSKCQRPLHMPEACPVQLGVWGGGEGGGDVSSSIRFGSKTR